MLKRAAGFSLVELLVTLAVLAFILAMGIPSLSTYITNSRVRAVASETRDGLQQARNEAIRRNATVSFCIQSSSGSGWEVRTGNDCATGSVISSKQTIASEEKSVALSPATLSVAFGSDGRVRTSSGTPGSGTAVTSVDTDWKNTCNSDDCVGMRVEISPGGMVRTCNRALAEGDPQACIASASSSSASSSSSSSSSAP